jgi:hypothetical protein
MGPAVVSCHVERPLDDRVWSRYSRLVARRPGGFRIASLMRPPDADAGEAEQRWLERAREAAAYGPFGLHTHWTSPSHARPTGGDPAARVRSQVEWLRERGLEPRYFAGGGWYMDERVAEVLAELGLVDCTATSFRPAYLEPDAPRVEAARPLRFSLPSGRTLLELPATHSLGMLARGLARPLRTEAVHVYFHDTDLLGARRRSALGIALRLLALRRRAADLDTLADLAPPTRPFAGAR